MQVDHIVPLYWYDGSDELNNMYPACRSCNHYKSTMTLEKFRKALEGMPDRLMRDDVTYKIAVRFKLVIPDKKRVVFFFEKKEKELTEPRNLIGQ